jgi:flagellar biogenesis protein FliO
LNNEETMIILVDEMKVCDKEFEPMKEMVIMLLIIVGWIVLQAYVLPRMGVST